MLVSGQTVKMSQLKTGEKVQAGMNSNKCLQAVLKNNLLFFIFLFTLLESVILRLLSLFDITRPQGNKMSCYKIDYSKSKKLQTKIIYFPFYRE